MSEIKPALSPEEWGAVPDLFVEVGCPERHAFAALALHGQPFGFTWEDVDLLRGVANTAYLLMENRPDGYWSGDVASADKLAADLADRIAALLPPREP